MSDRDERERPDHTALEARNRELVILGGIATALNARADLTGMLERALDMVIELLELDTGWIWLIDPESGEPYLAVARNLPPGLAEDPGTMEGGCWCLDALAKDRLDPATNIGVLECTRLRKLAHGTAGYGHHASIPLYAQGEKLGLMNVATAEWRELGEHTLGLLRTVSGVLGIAIARARLYDASARLGAAEERNRLARDFHDTLAQSLVAAAQQLEFADALLECGSTERDADEPRDGDGVARAHGAVRRALTLTRGTLEETRRSVHDLRVTPLDGRSLTDALRSEVESFQERTAIDASFTTVGAARPVSQRVEVGLLRVAQEALANVERHADASEVTVNLTATPSSIELVVRDDGRGFDTERLEGPPAGRFGVIGMNERAQLLGGRLSVASAPGDGTEIRVKAPLEAVGSGE